MNARYLGLMAIAGTLMMAGSAVAQGTAMMSLSVMPPAEPVSLTGGQSTTVTFNVNLHGSNFGCVQEATFPVAVTATSSRVTPVVDTPELAFSSGTGLYGDGATPATPPYNQTLPATVTVTAPSGTTSDFTDTLSLAANFPGGDFTDQTCGVGTFPATDGSGSVQINVVADALPDTGTGGDGGGGGDGGDGGGNGGAMNGTDEDSDDSPVGPFVLPLALIGAALLARRRRT